MSRVDMPGRVRGSVRTNRVNHWLDRFLTQKDRQNCGPRPPPRHYAPPSLTYLALTHTEIRPTHGNNRPAWRPAHGNVSVRCVKGGCKLVHGSSEKETLLDEMEHVFWSANS